VVERLGQQWKLFACAGLDHLHQAGMQSPGDCRRHRRVHRLSDEVMGQPDPARRLRHQAEGDELANRLLQPEGRPCVESAELLARRRTGHDREGAHEAGGIGGDRPQALADQVKGTGHVMLTGQRLEPEGGSGCAAPKLLRGRLAEPGIDRQGQGDAIVARQAAELQRAPSRPREDGVDPPGEGRGGRSVPGCGEHDERQRRRLRRSDEIVQERHRLGVDPLEIVDCEDERAEGLHRSVRRLEDR
jgi:hypothetical protein